MARRYYILRDGERLYRDTVQEITRLAQKTANAIGAAVQIHYTDTATTRTGKSHRAAPSRADTNVYSRNPAKEVKYIVVERDADGVGIARGPYSRAEAERDLPRLRDHYPDKKYSIEAAKYEGRGHQRRLKYPEFKKNPAPKRAKSTRGFWVEYKMSGGKVQRLKAGNKGIATIRANELKRSGYKGVRVYSA